MLIPILVAAASSMALGFAWYSPSLFGKPWMKLMGFTASSLKKAQASMGPMYGLSFLGALITAYVLYQFQADTTMAFWAWLGFIMPVQLTGEIFGAKPFNLQLLAINTSYQLASILLMATVIGWLS